MTETKRIQSILDKQQYVVYIYTHTHTHTEFRNVCVSSELIKLKFNTSQGSLG